MMSTATRRLLMWVIVACAVATARCATARAHDELFGQNQPHAAPSSWRSIETARFRVLFPGSAEVLAAETLGLAQAAADDIGTRLGVRLTKRSTWVVFPSRDAMVNSNIPRDELEEGLRAWTPLVRRRQVIVFSGSRAELARDVAHGVTHALQTQVLFPTGGWSVVGTSPLYHAPDWFLEGTALYFAGAAGTEQEIDLRGASLANRLLSLEELADFNDVPDLGLAYMQARSIAGYLAEEFGEASLGRLLTAVAARPRSGIDWALTEVAGIDLRTLNRRWQRYAKKRYWPLIREKESPEGVARALRIPVNGHAADAAWSKSGEVLATLVRTYDRDEVWLVSARTGAPLKRATARARGRYDSIVARGRALAWAWDSDSLAFLARHGGGLRLLMVDVITGQIAHETDLPFHDAFSVTVSADGSTVVMVGITDGQADLYAYAPADGSWRRVTNDAYLDADPILDADGAHLLYVSERDGQTRLVRRPTDPAGAEETLLDGAGGIHDPQWADDVDGVYFTADWTGSRDVYRYPTPDGGARRLTNLISGANTPALSPDGESLAFSADQGGRQTVFVLPMSSAEREPTELPARALADVPEPRPAARVDARGIPRGLVLDDVRFAFHTPVDGVPRAGVEVTAASWTGNARMRLNVVTTYRDLPNVALSGQWLRSRADASVEATSRAVFHRATSGGGDLVTEREEGVRGSVSYPLSVRRRLVASAAATRAPVAYRYAGAGTAPGVDDPLVVGEATLSLVHDTVAVSTRLGPVSGLRYRLEASRAVGRDGVSALSFSADARKYARLGARTVFATRVTLARSDGDTPRISYLGGHTSLRASEFEEFSGDRVAMASVELRVPLLNELQLAWPARVGVRGVRGVLFVETGMAWNEGDKPRVARRTDEGLRLEDLGLQYGFGARARMLGLRLRLDIARGHDLVSASAWRSLFRVDRDF